MTYTIFDHAQLGHVDPGDTPTKPTPKRKPVHAVDKRKLKPRFNRKPKWFSNLGANL